MKKNVKQFIKNNKKNVICLFFAVLSYYLVFLFDYISLIISYSLISNYLEYPVLIVNKICDILKVITLLISILLTFVYTKSIFDNNFNLEGKNSIFHKIYKKSFLPYYITLFLGVLGSLLDSGGSFIDFGGGFFGIILVIILCIICFFPVYIIALTYQILYKIRNK